MLPVYCRIKTAHTASGGAWGPKSSCQARINKQNAAQIAERSTLSSLVSCVRELGALTENGMVWSKYETTPIANSVQYAQARKTKSIPERITI